MEQMDIGHYSYSSFFLFYFYLFLGAKLGEHDDVICFYSI